MMIVRHIFQVFRLVVLINCCHSIYCGRSVPARWDVCNRLPHLAICSQSGPAADTSPVGMNSGVNIADDSQSLDALRVKYCQRFQDNFQYYCLGAGKGDRSAKDFCPSYTDLCGADWTQPKEKLSRSDAEEQLKQICLHYQPTAATYCTGPANERGDIRKNCDRYRSNCGDFLDQTASTQRKQTPGCLKYQQLYFTKCATQNPTTPEEITFCTNFANSCSPDDLVPPKSGVSSDSDTELVPPPAMPSAGPAPTRSVPSASPSFSSGPVGSADTNAGAPMTIGSGTQVGNIAGTSQQTAISPLGGVSSSRTANAGPIAVTSGSGMNFGGLLPNLMGRRR